MIKCINCCYRASCDNTSNELKECDYYKHISAEIKKLEDLNDELIKEIRSE